MAIYDRSTGYKVRITAATIDTFTSASMYSEELFISAVYDDERLSSKLNGTRCWHPKRLEKAKNVVKADGGFDEVKEAARKFLK